LIVYIALSGLAGFAIYASTRLCHVLDIAPFQGLGYLRFHGSTRLRPVLEEYALSGLDIF